MERINNSENSNNDEAQKAVSIKINQTSLGPYQKPVSRDNIQSQYKTFKGASICPKCGAAGFLRIGDKSKCLNCGHSE